MQSPPSSDLVQVFSPEVLEFIFDACDLVTQYLLRFTCKSFLCLSVHVMIDSDFMFRDASMIGEATLLQWFVDTYPSLAEHKFKENIGDNLVGGAAMSGSVTCLQWVISNNYLFCPTSALRYAAKVGQYETFKYIIDTYRDDLGEVSEVIHCESKRSSVMYNILAGDNAQIFYAFTSLYPSSIHFFCLRYAEMVASVDMFLRVCREVGAEVETHLSYRNVAKYGNTQLLQYLYEIEREFIENNVDEIVSLGAEKYEGVATLFWVRHTFPEYFKKGGEVLKKMLVGIATQSKEPWPWRIEAIEDMFV